MIKNKNSDYVNKDYLRQIYYLFTKSYYIRLSIDERKEFACKELFPEANEIHCVSFDKADSYFPKEANTCYVIVTRGHKDDCLCLKKDTFSTKSLCRNDWKQEES